MATDNKENTPTVAPRVMVGEDHDTSVSAYVGPNAGGDKGRVENHDATSVELKSNTPAEKVAVKDALQEIKDGEDALDKADGATEEAASTTEPLGEWNKDDPEVVSKFDARFLDKTGKLNMEALGKEAFALAEKNPDKKPGISAATRAYLKDAFDISDGMIDDVTDALNTRNAAKAVQGFEPLYKAAGGKATFDAAVEWGKKNYTEAQRTRFNALVSKGGDDAADAVDALMARYGKAGRPGAPQSNSNLRQQRRRSAPERTTSGAAAGEGTSAAPNAATGVAPFRDTAHYQEEWGKAVAERRKASSSDRAAADRKLDAMRAQARAQGLGR